MRRTVGLYLGARVSGQITHNLFLATLFIIAGSSQSSAIGISSVVVALTGASLAFGLIGGTISDRIGLGRGFALGAGLRNSAMLLAFISLRAVPALFVVAFVYSMFAQIYTTSEMGLVRAICGRSAGRLHSVIVALQYGAQGFAFLVLAPVLYYLGGPAAALMGALVIGSGHAVLAGLLAMRVPRGDATGELGEAARGYFSGLRATMRVFRDSELARDALATLSMKAIVAQVILVAFPMYVKHDLSLGTEGAVVLLAPGVAGVAAGLLWAAFALKVDGAVRTMRLAILGLTVSVFALAALDYGVSAAFVYSKVPPLVHFEAALNTTAIVAMPVAFLIGASICLSLVSARVALTAAAPLGIQSRVFAVQATASDAFVLIPTLFAGVAAELFGARMTLGLLGVVCSLVWLALWSPHFQLRVLSVRSPAVS